MALAEGYARAQIDQRNGVILQCIGQCRRCDQWQRLFSVNLDCRQRQTTAHATFKHIRLMPQLTQPTGDNRCTHTVAINQHQTRLTYTDIQISRLNQLPARRVLCTGKTAGGKLLGGAHVT
ncbi:hypothetical protein D3C85_679360 [compost metagenome]